MADDKQVAPFFPTFYNLGGQWGFTCVWCKVHKFGYSSKGFAEDGMLYHFDWCESFPPQWKDPIALRMRKEVQDFGVGVHPSIGDNVRDVYGAVR